MPDSDADAELDTVNMFHEADAESEKVETFSDSDEADKEEEKDEPTELSQVTLHSNHN